MYSSWKKMQIFHSMVLKKMQRETYIILQTAVGKLWSTLRVLAAGNEAYVYVEIYIYIEYNIGIRLSGFEIFYWLFQRQSYGIGTLWWLLTCFESNTGVSTTQLIFPCIQEMEKFFIRVKYRDISTRVVDRTPKFDKYEQNNL